VFGPTGLVIKLIVGIVGAVLGILFSPIVLIFIVWGIVRLLAPRRRYTTA